jgi:ribosomal protein S18 acetylase RimI-like enzyme
MHSPTIVQKLGWWGKRTTVRILLLTSSMFANTFAGVEDKLHNPVFNALLSGDAHLSFGTEKVKYFNEQVSPFAGFHQEYDKGFDDLYYLLPAGRNILYAIPQPINEPKGWQILNEIKGLQFVYEGTNPGDYSIKPVSLNNENIEEMMQLAALTKPGPFGPRTIDFGHYHGIFENGQLVAMTGQRLHAGNYTELSAVCTHPNYLGKGYAAALMLHQLDLIIGHGQLPFLHVREDNSRAIALYERLGFKVKRGMNFYFMKRRAV